MRTSCQPSSTTSIRPMQYPPNRWATNTYQYQGDVDVLLNALWPNGYLRWKPRFRMSRCMWFYSNFGSRRGNIFKLINWLDIPAWMDLVIRQLNGGVKMDMYDNESHDIYIKTWNHCYVQKLTTRGKSETRQRAKCSDEGKKLLYIEKFTVRMILFLIFFFSAIHTKL